jgi:hypothetical protein
MKEYKLLKKLMDEFKRDIILNEYAYDDDLPDTFDNVIETAKQLHGALEKFIESNE